jgi:hypothetical protein
MCIRGWLVDLFGGIENLSLRVTKAETFFEWSVFNLKGILQIVERSW